MFVIEAKQFSTGTWLKIKVAPTFESRRRAAYWLNDHRPARGNLRNYRIAEIK